MVQATILGFPRIGRTRELKFALEKYWKGQSSAASLLETACALRATHLTWQKEAGLGSVPSGDFSFYDRMLDMAALFGVVPTRYGWDGTGSVDLDLYFAMARGAQRDGMDVPAAEMTKWFDTNYHYIVPEFPAHVAFRLCGDKPVRDYREAVALGHAARPVLIGPVTFLALGKCEEGGDPLLLLDRLLPAYAEALRQLQEAGATWVQLDEPLLVTDLSDSARHAYNTAYTYLRQACGLKFLVTTPFGALDDNLDLAVSLPIDALHLDMVRGEGQLNAVLAKIPPTLILALGVVSGRNIWRNDLEKSLVLCERAVETIGADRVWVTTSCSLVHVPYDLDAEKALDPEIKDWMAFARQKMTEVATVARGLVEGRAAIAAALRDSERVVALRRRAPRIHNPAVKARVKREPLATAGRAHPFVERRPQQRARLGLPLFPTTTIGSFPQTGPVRKARADFKKA